MKRSDAIKLMIAFEEQALKRFGYSLSRAEIMDGILTQLEKAGMQPPNIKLTDLYPVLDKTEHLYALWEPEE